MRTTIGLCALVIASVVGAGRGGVAAPATSDDPTGASDRAELVAEVRAAIRAGGVPTLPAAGPVPSVESMAAGSTVVVTDPVGDAVNPQGDVIEATVAWSVWDERLMLEVKPALFEVPVSASWVYEGSSVRFDLDFDHDAVWDRSVLLMNDGSGPVYVLLDAHDNVIAVNPWTWFGFGTYVVWLPPSALGSPAAIRWQVDLYYDNWLSGVASRDRAPDAGWAGPWTNPEVCPPKMCSADVLMKKVTGVDGVPSTGVSAVSLNVTVTAPEEPGFITVYACGDRPLASNLNYVKGQTVPNAVIAPVSADGYVCFYAEGSTHLLADVNGWFATGGGYSSVVPARLFDTRDGTGGVPATKVTPSTVLTVNPTGRHGIPATGVTAVSLNVTVTQPSAAGFITVWPCDAARPWASNLNYTAGQTIPNAVIAPVAADGNVCFHAEGTTHLLADVNGWFATGGGFHALTPYRVFDTRS